MRERENIKESGGINMKADGIGLNPALPLELCDCSLDT